MSGGEKWIAITHLPSPNLQGGERTYAGREPIDIALAARQHEAYRAALKSCGASVVVLDANRSMADSVFIEDTAIVLDEIAVMMSMGAESRRAEPPAIEAALTRYRPIERVSLPATIDGGDVVHAGRALYVGASARTNGAGIASLREIVKSLGYTVTAVPVHGCLHLKSACSALPDGRFLVNPEWIDASPLPAASLVQVPRSEEDAGDVLAIDSTIIASDAFPQTIAMLGGFGFDVIPVSVSEFAKAEGAVTCLSLVFRH
ncbi:MAG: dimethylarginine dimethylaminohydrolase family protein [Gemmatimonadaceae bacterium]